MGCVAWRLDLTCCPPWSGLDPARQVSLARAAVDTMWALTGRQFGVCDTLVRPCRHPCTAAASLGIPLTGPGWTPMLRGGQVYNVSACGCTAGCSCATECRVRLDPAPVHPGHPVVVTIDGVLLDPHAYHVVDGRWLVRLDGGCWPSCQRFDRPDGAAGVWSVGYHHGLDPPDGLLLATESLLCELGKACVPGSGCKLPQRVQQMVRDGVTMVLIDRQDYLKELLSGLPEVDAQIKALNPYGAPQAGEVTSPDIVKPSRITWTAPP